MTSNNFEGLLGEELRPNSRIYASPSIGDDKMHSIIYHENTGKVIFCQPEMVGLEKYFQGNNRVEAVPYTIRDYALDLNTTSSGVDHEFVALPGRRSAPRAGGTQITEKSIKNIVEDWTAISDRLVSDQEGNTYYLDTIWRDKQGSPRAPELTPEKIHQAEEDALQQYFEHTEVLEGEDYSLVKASR